MITINPYLNFAGNTEEAFNFYRSVFGGEFLAVMRYKDTFEAERTPEADGDKLMHIAFPVGKGNMLMATDAIGEMGKDLTQGNSFYICINGETVAETEKLFNGLAAGGKVMFPFGKAPWGAYFGQLIDKFGVQWMTDCPDPEAPQPNSK
jgi:uncharacterized glyoxalase superfamily protein PhnB